MQSSGKVRFNLWKPTLEKRSGMRFENGRMYVVRGTVDGMEFESRHMGGAGPAVYVCMGGDTPGVVPGERYRLVVEAIEEKRRFEALPSTRGPCIRVTRPVLEGLGVRTGERSVVELTLKRAGEERQRKVYARWEPDWGFTQLYLSGLEFVEGDVVEVVGGRRYSLESFVEEFRVRKLREMENVELGLEDGSPTMAVDGRQIPVEGYWLTTHGLKAALKLKLGYGHKTMKFVFDGSSVEAKFGNSDPILEWSAVGSGVDVRYSRGAGQAYVMRLEQKPVRSPGEDFDWLVGGVRVTERPKEIHGMYLLEMSEVVQETARQKLNQSTDDTYPRVRGDIGEGIMRQLWDDMRMKLLYDHPWSELGAGYGSLRKGPDFMVRCLDSGLAGYLEGKWHEDFVRAFGEARNQVMEHFQLKPDWKGIEIEAAYIAVIDWRLTKTARLWVERVA